MKRKTRGTRMVEAAVEQLKRETQKAYETPPSKGTPLKAPGAPERKNPRKCQFQFA